MQKIINGRKYDTETAVYIGKYSEYLPGDFHYYEEKLYRKRNGEFFLYGEGGPASKYRDYIGRMYISGSAIVPVTEEEAKQWAECALEVGDYEELFGEVEE